MTKGEGRKEQNGSTSSFSVLKYSHCHKKALVNSLSCDVLRLC